MRVTLSAGRTRADIALTAPAGLKDGDGVLQVSLATLTALIPAGDSVDMSDFKMGPSGSETIEATVLHAQHKVEVFGLSNMEANVTVFRSLTDGNPDEQDVVYAALGEKGVYSYWFIREGRKATTPLAIGDTGFIYECLSDDAQSGGPNSGVIKATLPLAVQWRREFEIVA
jgi:hypothetical protein